MRNGDDERAERGTSGQWRLRVAALGCGAALILSACAGDSPESVEAALGDTAPNLAFVDDSEGTCVGEAIMRAVGFEQLAADGHTSETIRTTSPEAISAIVDGAGDDVRDGIIECLDVNGLVRTEVTALNGNDELACAETDFSVDTPFVDQYIQARFDDSNAELSIDDTDENRDLLRPCLSEASFAETFGLDTRDALEAAIEDALPATVQSADGPCIGSLVINHYGSAEAANEAGLTSNSPKVDLDELDLEEADRTSLISDAGNCVPIRHDMITNFRATEPNFSTCLTNFLNGPNSSAWVGSQIEAELGTPAARTKAERERNAALSSCVDQRVQLEFFGQTVEQKTHAEILADDIWDQLNEYDPEYSRFGYTKADTQCAANEIARSVDVARLADLELVADFENPSNELIELSNQFWWALNRGFDICISGHIYWLSPAIQRNFSNATVDCIRDEIGSPHRLRAQFLDLWTNTEISVSEFFLEQGILQRQLTNAVEDCHSADEQQLYEDWEAWLTDDGESATDDFNAGEPDSVST